MLLKFGRQSNRHRIDARLFIRIVVLRVLEHEIHISGKLLWCLIVVHLKRKVYEFLLIFFSFKLKENLPVVVRGQFEDPSDDQRTANNRDGQEY